MKTPPGNRSIEYRFCLMLILLLATAAYTLPVSAAQQEQGKGQIAVTPPASGGDSQQAASTPRDAGKSSVSLAYCAAAPPSETAPTGCPPQYAPIVRKITASLKTPRFTFVPAKVLDPFVPFISLQAPPQPDDEPKPGTILTPLQKMTITEIRSGLKGISWGALGRRAVIEDSTGKGYIVSVGTPAGGHSGVITKILDDRIIIEQQIWSSKARKKLPLYRTVKLVKKTEGNV